MIKRVCPLCGKEHYSSVEQEDWPCDNCGHNLTPEMNKSIVKIQRQNKVKINPVAFRYFKNKTGKSALEIAGDWQAAASVRRIIQGETNEISEYLLKRFADNMSVDVNELLPNEKSDKIIREFLGVK